MFAASLAGETAVRAAQARHNAVAPRHGAAHQRVWRRQAAAIRSAHVGRRRRRLK